MDETTSPTLEVDETSTSTSVVEQAAETASVDTEAAEDAALAAIADGKKGTEVADAVRAAAGDDDATKESAPAKPTDSPATDTPATLDDATTHLLNRWKCDPAVVAAMPETARNALIAQLDAQAKVMDQVFRERAELRKAAEAGGKPQAKAAEPKAEPLASEFDVDEETLRELEDNFGTGSKAVLRAAQKMAQSQTAQVNAQMASMWRAQEVRDERAGFNAALEGAPPSLKALTEKPEARTKIIDTAMAILKAEAAKPGFDLATTNLSTAIPQAFRALYAQDLQKHEQFKLAQARSRAMRSQPDRSGLNSSKPQQTQRPTIEDAEDRVLAGLSKGVKGVENLRALAYGS